MPVYRHPENGPANRNELVCELTHEWTGQTSHNEPIIIVNEMGQTRTLHVLVVWEAWRGVAETVRSSIIMDAYERGFPDAEPRISIALGLTMDEATAMGYFPYSIEPQVRESDGVAQEEIRNVMIAEGAVETPRGLVLRFQKLQAAMDTYQKLDKEQPGAWALTEREPEPSGI